CAVGVTWAALNALLRASLIWVFFLRSSNSSSSSAPQPTASSSSFLLLSENYTKARRNPETRNMSSFHPLGPAAKDSHPLTGRTAAAGLPFHDDDEDAWTPPSLPGEASALGSSGRGNAGGGSSSSSIRSPLDQAPLHPLGGGVLSAGDTSAHLGNNSNSFSHSSDGGGGVGDV
ncbi:unnamed protein product, partial [Laminaria digitata]